MVFLICTSWNLCQLLRISLVLQEKFMNRDISQTTLRLITKRKYCVKQAKLLNFKSTVLIASEAFSGIFGDGNTDLFQYLKETLLNFVQKNYEKVLNKKQLHRENWNNHYQFLNSS